MQLPKTLALGTGNPGKAQEYQAILEELGFRIQMVSAPEPEETAPDLEGNARLKAISYARRAGTLTIADDSGVVVPALHGLPGVVSARFAECEIDLSTGKVLSHRPSGLPRAELDARNRTRVIELLEGRKGEERAASFRAVLACANEEGVVLFAASGEIFGRITERPRGSGGFGYDSIFEADGDGGRTYAELDEREKNSRSHRRIAIEKLRDWLLAERYGLAPGAQRAVAP